MLTNSERFDFSEGDFKGYRIQKRIIKVIISGHANKFYITIFGLRMKFIYTKIMKLVR